MKMQRKRLWCCLLLCLFKLHCGAVPDSVGGTETGTTDPIDTAQLSTRMQAVASALVPSITVNAASSSGSSTRSKALQSSTVGTSDEWVVYTDDANSHVLTDVFGDPAVAPAVVTKIRVLLAQFANTVGGLVAQDAKLACVGGKALNEGDTVTIPFYGAISNGTATDRRFDCHATESGTSTETRLYGQDSSGAIRIVTMSDVTSTNTEDAATRGDTQRLLQVVASTYAEATSGDTTTAYLDLQYAQATLYPGLDVTAGTADDIIFKSRSRITGRAVLDASGKPSLAAGEFVVTKYDLHSGTTVTQVIGRGDYGTDGYSWFHIDSDVSGVVAIPRSFCLQGANSGTGIPTQAAESNCASLETVLAWGTESFPFTITPELVTRFDAITFFAGNDTDLISNDGSNFTIPTYTTKAVTAADDATTVVSND